MVIIICRHLYTLRLTVCFASILFLIVLHAVQSCDDVTQFTCSNSVCISLRLVNNSINDCGDNSDEVSQPCQSPLFSCHNNRCVMLDWILDGNDDCLDGTDETKLIGTRCNVSLTCCFCHVYVTHSECRNDVCLCSAGYYSNDLGTECNLRLGSACNHDNECSGVVAGSVCTDAICRCEQNRYASEDNTTCIKRALEEPCVFDSHCSGVGVARCQQGYCACQPGYKTAPNRTACLHRLIREPCDNNNDCILPHSSCDVGHCSCNPGFREASRRSACVARLVGDLCSADEDCSIADALTTCGDGYCACRPDYFYQSTNPEVGQCGSHGKDVVIMAVYVVVIGVLLLINTFLVLWMCSVYVCHRHLSLPWH